MCQVSDACINGKVRLHSCNTRPTDTSSLLVDRQILSSYGKDPASAPERTSDMASDTDADAAALARMSNTARIFYGLDESVSYFLAHLDTPSLRSNEEFQC